MQGWNIKRLNYSAMHRMFMFELHLIKHSTRGQHHHDPFKILHFDLVIANNILTLSQKRQTHITTMGSIFVSFHTVLFPTSWILDRFNLTVPSHLRPQPFHRFFFFPKVRTWCAHLKVILAKLCKKRALGLRTPCTLNAWISVCACVPWGCHVIQTHIFPWLQTAGGLGVNQWDKLLVGASAGGKN